MNWGKWGMFAAGVLFGTAGIKLLSSKDAKKAYTHATAAALRAAGVRIYTEEETAALLTATEDTE